jgi:hypothetical protein
MENKARHGQARARPFGFFVFVASTNPTAPKRLPQASTEIDFSNSPPKLTGTST